MASDISIVLFGSLSILIVPVTSVEQNCVPDNQFINYCFSLTYCEDTFCKEEDCGHFSANAKLVTLNDAKIIPQCAFSNTARLKYIIGGNKNVRAIASGAFVNLPGLESILLPFNFIRELHHGIFQNVTLSTLDLSWNRIIYIQEGAFEGINGLQHLNLSRNELFTIPVPRLSPSLLTLNLSNNYLNDIAISDRFPKLTAIDFSHNTLERAAFFFAQPIEEIDLTNNRLKDIDFYQVPYCQRLKLSRNQFSSVPQRFLKYKIGSVELYSNPWKCSELNNLWKLLQDNHIAVADSQSSEEDPICFESVSQFAKLITLQYCEDDSGCASTQLCKGAKCYNPCEEHVCDPGSICLSENHKFECLCPESQKRDPRSAYSACHDVQCFLRSDCQERQFCNSSNLCQRFPATRPSISQESLYGVSHSTKAFVRTEQPWWYYEIRQLPPSDNQMLK